MMMTTTATTKSLMYVCDHFMYIYIFFFYFYFSISILLFQTQNYTSLKETAAVICTLRLTNECTRRIKRHKDIKSKEKKEKTLAWIRIKWAHIHSHTNTHIHMIIFSLLLWFVFVYFLDYPILSYLFRK